MRRLPFLLVITALIVALAGGCTMSTAQPAVDRAVPPTALLVPTAIATAQPTETSTATATATSTATPTPTLTPTSSATATPTTTPIATATRAPLVLGPAPAGRGINGLVVGQILRMDEAARTNVRAIHARGRAAGNKPNAFSKLGDSTFELPLFLGAFDGYTSTQYALGNYAWLTDTIRAFAGSWGRPSIAVVRGLSAPGMFDPSWVNPALGCESMLGPLVCELNVHRPAFLLMRLGANDDGNAARYAYFLRRAITTTLEANVVPVLSTRADRSNDPDDAKNTIVRQLASEFKLPVWDFDALAATLPERGLREDHVHLTYFFSNDFRDPAAFASGAAMHNLSAVLVMDELLRALGP